MRSRIALPFTRLGEYELGRLLATGGMSEVYEARRDGPHGFQKRFAVKRILPQLAGDERLMKMFCDEARVHSALSHPNLVQVVDFGEARGELYMVMEFVDGPSIARVMKALAGRQRTMPLPQALYIARQVLEGLDYAHLARDPTTGLPLGVVHRDVAPSNILIGSAGEVKLADFGIVSSLINDARSDPNEIKGKLGYVSPEQAMGQKVDTRSDVFSMGIVLAEMLIGAPLFAGRTPLEALESLYSGNLKVLVDRGAHLPSDVQSLLRRALGQEPALRYPSAREFADHLDSIVRRHGFDMGNSRLIHWLIDLGVVSLRSDIRAMTTARPVAPSFRSRAERRSSLPPAALSPSSMPPSELEDAIVRTARESEIEYRVRRPGGTIVGPLRLARLLEMIATARAGVDTLVSRAGGPFLPLSSMHELLRLVARPAYRFFDPVSLMATDRSAINRLTLPSKLYAIAFGRKTGLVAATAGCERFRCFFTQGVLSATASTDPSELLGSCLVQTGQVEAHRLDDLLERGFRRGLRLGEALVDSGAMGPEALARTLFAQRVRRLAGLLGWTRGDLVFVEGANAGEEEGELATGRLLTSALRVAYGDQEIEALCSGFHDGCVSSLPAFEERLPELGLDAAESSLLRHISRGGRLRDLISALPSDSTGPAFRVAFIALSAGLLTLPGSPL
ncbi:MAG TPA: protein kinase [Polyangiaceae bacterium]|nr:protein kinase [Polyangiaceae bacterium]